MKTVEEIKEKLIRDADRISCRICEGCLYENDCEVDDSCDFLATGLDSLVEWIESEEEPCHIIP